MENIKINLGFLSKKHHETQNPNFKAIPTIKLTQIWEKQTLRHAALLKLRIINPNNNDLINTSILITKFARGPTIIIQCIVKYNI